MIDLSFAVKITFWVFGLSPDVMMILVALNVFCNAARTYDLQPPHVTPVISSVYVVSSPLTVVTASARRPNVARISFFITILYSPLFNYLLLFDDLAITLVESPCTTRCVSFDPDLCPA